MSLQAIGLHDNYPSDPYESLRFDFNLIRSLPTLMDVHPDLMKFDLSREYQKLSERLDKDGITESWQIAHLDSYMLLHLFKFGAIPFDAAERLTKSGHISLYETALFGEVVYQKCVRLLPKGLTSIMKSLEDHRVSTQVFPSISDLSNGVDGEMSEYFYFIENCYASTAVCKRIFAGKYNPYHFDE